MQSVLRKIRSLPALLKTGDHTTHILSHAQFLKQVELLDNLIDTMLDESTDETVLVYAHNKDPRHIHLPNACHRVISEARRQRIHRSFLYLLFHTFSLTTF